MSSRTESIFASTSCRSSTVARRCSGGAAGTEDALQRRSCAGAIWTPVSERRGAAPTWSLRRFARFAARARSTRSSTEGIAALGSVSGVSIAPRRGFAPTLGCVGSSAGFAVARGFADPPERLRSRPSAQSLKPIAERQQRVHPLKQAKHHHSPPSETRHARIWRRSQKEMLLLQLLLAPSTILQSGVSAPKIALAPASALD